MKYDLLELGSSLDSLNRDPKFLTTKDSLKQEAIRGMVDMFSEKNPDSSEDFKNLGAQYRLNHLRENGLGRHKPNQAEVSRSLSSLIPDLKFSEDGNIDFGLASDDEKLEIIERARKKSLEVAKEVDYLNAEDVSFYVNQLLNNQERYVRGKDTGYVADKFYRMADSFTSSIIAPFSAETSGEITSEYFPENPNRDEEFTAKLASGAGDLVGQTAVFVAVSAAATPAVATGTLFAANASRKFQENYLQAIELGSSEQDAFAAGINALPASVIDSMGDRLIAGKFIPSQLKNKLSSSLAAATSESQRKAILKETLLGLNKNGLGKLATASRDALAEGFSESAADFAAGYGGYLATGREEFIPSNKELFDSFAVGGILGGGASLTGSLVNDQNLTEEQANAIASSFEKSKEAVKKLEEGDLAGASKIVAEIQDTKKEESKEKNTPKEPKEKNTPKEPFTDVNALELDTAYEQLINPQDSSSDLSKSALAKIKKLESLATEEQIQRIRSKVSLNAIPDSITSSLDDVKANRSEKNKVASLLAQYAIDGAINGSDFVSDLAGLRVVRNPDASLTLVPVGIEPEGADLNSGIPVPDSEITTQNNNFTIEDEIRIKSALSNLSNPKGLNKRTLQRNRELLSELSSKDPESYKSVYEDWNSSNQNSESEQIAKESEQDSKNNVTEKEVVAARSDAYKTLGVLKDFSQIPDDYVVDQFESPSKEDQIRASAGLENLFNAKGLSKTSLERSAADVNRVKDQYPEWFKVFFAQFEYDKGDYSNAERITNNPVGSPRIVTEKSVKDLRKKYIRTIEGDRVDVPSPASIDRDAVYTKTEVNPENFNESESNQEYSEREQAFIKQLTSTPFNYGPDQALISNVELDNGVVSKITLESGVVLEGKEAQDVAAEALIANTRERARRESDIYKKPVEVIPPNVADPSKLVSTIATDEDINNALDKILGEKGRKKVRSEKRLHVHHRPDLGWKGGFNSNRGIYINTAYLAPEDLVDTLEHEIAHAAYRFKEVREAMAELSNIDGILSPETEQKIIDIVKRNYKPDAANEEIDVIRFNEIRKALRKEYNKNSEYKSWFKKLLDAIRNFFKSEYNSNLETAQRITDRVIEVGVNSWLISDYVASTGDAALDNNQTTALQKVTNKSVGEVYKEIGNNLDLYNVEGGINWSYDKDAIGITPFQQDIDYFGFTFHMSYSDFRSLVPRGVSGDNTGSFLQEAFSSGKKIGPPFLMVDWDSENSQWILNPNNHEGRSRSDFSNKVSPEATIPVHIMPSGIRARNITSEMLEAPIVVVNEASVSPKVPVNHNGERYKESSETEFQKLDSSEPTNKSVTPEDVEKFNNLTSSLYDGNPTPTSEDIAAWREENPEAWQELSEMRERVLRGDGYDTKVYHGSQEKNIKSFTTPLFAGDEKTANDYSNIYSKKSKGAVYPLLVNKGKVLNLFDYNGWVDLVQSLDSQGLNTSRLKDAIIETAYNDEFGPLGSEDRTWDNYAREKRSINTSFPWDVDGNELSAAFREDQSSFIGVNNKSRILAIKDLGFDSAIQPEGGYTETEGSSIILFNPNQIKFADPVLAGPKVTPDQWADSSSPDIRFQKVNSEPTNKSVKQSSFLDKINKDLAAYNEEKNKISNRRVKELLALIPNFDPAKKAVSFLRNITKKGNVNAEDFVIANNLASIFKALPNMVKADLPVFKNAEKVFDLIINFRNSRDVRIIDGVDSRETTFDFGDESGALSLSSKILREYNTQYSEHLVKKFEALGYSKYEGELELEKVEEWIREESLKVEALSEGESEKEINDNLKQEADAAIAEFISYDPSEWLDMYQDIHGPISDTQKGDLEELVSEAQDYLGDFDSDSNYQYKKAFITADAFNNFQVNSLRGITFKKRESEITKKSVTFSDKFKSMFTLRFLKPLVGTEKFDITAKRVSYSKEVQQFITEEVFGPLQESFLKAHDESNKMTEAYTKLRDEYLTDLKVKPENQVEDEIWLMMAAHLMQTKFHPSYTPEKSFVENYAKIKKSIENRSLSPEKKVRDMGIKIAEVFEKLTQGIDIDSGSSYQDFMSDLNSRLSYDGDIEKGNRRVKLLEDVSGIFDETKAALKFVTEAYRGQPFQDISNYVPTHVISTINATPNDDLDAPAMEMLSPNYENLSSRVSETKGRSAGLGNDGYYDYNMDSVIARQINSTNIEIFTTPHRVYLNSLLKNGSEFSRTIGNGNDENARVLRSRIVLMMQNELRRGESIPSAIRLTRQIGKQLAKVHLSGIHQVFSQPAAALSHWGLRNIGRGQTQNMLDALHILGTRYGEFKEFLKTHNRPLFERATASQVELDKAPIEETRSTLRKILKKFDKGSENVLLAPLKTGDGFASKLIFLTEYISAAKETGDLGQDGRQLDFSKPNFRLIDRANRRSDEFIGPSSRRDRGLFFSDTNFPIAFVRQSMFAYAHHLTSLGSQLQRNLSDLYHSTKNKDKSDLGFLLQDTAGIFGQIASFSAIKFAINAGVASLIIGMIKDIYDDEEGKISKIQEKIDNAKTKEEKDLWKEELRYAEAIRGIVNKEKQKRQTGEALFKNMFRDTLTGAHIIFNTGEGALPKIMFGVFDKAERKEFSKIKEDEARAMSERIKELRKIGKDSEAARLTEILVNLNDSEYIPLLYDIKTDTPFGGMLGASFESVVEPLKGFQGAYIPRLYGREPVNKFDEYDFAMGLAPMGIGQSDLTRFFRTMSKIEKDLWKIDQDKKNKKPEKKKETSVDVLFDAK